MSEEIRKEARIGVFVCHCGSNIGGLVDCKKLADIASKLPMVVHAEDNLYTCSEGGLTSIKNAVKEHDLNRVVVASCTPRTHEPLFRETIVEAGLNQYLFNFVNIRDQCTWVHMKDPEGAFEKARDVIRMGVAKAANLEALEDIDIIVKIIPAALVIGGGISGMTSALSLSNQGYQTYLIERDDKLGGMLNSLHTIFPHGQKASVFLDGVKSKIKSAKNLTVHMSSIVKSINGFVGNYNVSIDQNGKDIEIKVGAIVVAVGASHFTPVDVLGYDGKTRVTQFELEKKLNDGDIKASNVVMIQCVGSRIEERKYCSSVCCMTALKNALIIKEKNPTANVTIVFRDLYTPGIEYESHYRKAREQGILFLKYTLGKTLDVSEENVRVYNEYLGEEVILPYDLLVLSTPMVANKDNKELAQMIKVPLEENKFFLEAHVKLRPNDFATAGVYVCGAAKWPSDITESISQGFATASRAGTILAHDTIEVEGATADLPVWNKDLCKGCEVCIEVCPFSAIRKNENDDIEINRALCKGCGTCGATCTKKAISIKHFTNNQIISEIFALGGKIIQ